MRYLICVMNARRIPRVRASLLRLGCDLAWMTGYTDAELGAVHENLVRETDYDAYITLSDDCVVSKRAVDAVAGLLEQGHPAATGWCRLHRDTDEVNLTREPLRGNVPRRQAYTFWSYRSVREHPASVVPTHFMGLTLTGMPREMWERFPHCAFVAPKLERGYSSDFNLCMRLRDAGVPMVAAREGYVEHLKVIGRPQPPELRLLIGELPKQVTLERR